MKSFFVRGYDYLKRFGIRGVMARYLLYTGELQMFIRRARTPNEKAVRKDLVLNFSRIQRNLPCGHSPFQFMEMAEHILALDIEGPMVECGCFEGGSTAKLSLLAKQTKRRLFVCDSFQGMPSLPEGVEGKTYTGTSFVPNSTVYKGKFDVGLDKVKTNIDKHGCLEVCEFIPGFFESTLPALDIEPSVVYMDLGPLISSAHDCLKSLWPKLKPGGYWFTHEASYIDYILGIFDPKWWLEKVGEPPPLVIGAGSGLSLLSPSLAYFRKPPL